MRAYVASLVMPTEPGFHRTVSLEDVGGSRVLEFLFASLFGLALLDVTTRVAFGSGCRRSALGKVGRG